MPLSIDIMEDERRRKQREEEERMRVQAQNQQMNTFATQPSYTYTRAFNEPQTAGQFLGNIIQLQQTDPLGAEAGMALFNLQTKDPTSNLYNPYMESTNKAVSNLAAYGVDTSNMDDNWYNAMYNQFAPYWQYNGTTNTPSSPGKKASAMEKAAYEFYQIYKSKNDTDSAKKEWEDLQKELSYWANRTDRNYSDDEIINMIDWSKYSTLKRMDDTKQLAPMELNEGIGYSKDAMYGVLWAARNGQDASNTLTNMAYSALGVGNKWEDNPEIRAKLDRGNKATYSPFSVGGTADDVLSYFGVGSINQAWIDANAPKLANGSDIDRKMLGKAIEAVNTTTKAQEELAELNAYVDDMVSRGKSADFIQKQIDKKLKSTYTTLAKMDSYIDSYGTDDFVGTTEAVDYKYRDLIARMQEECTNKSENETNGFQTVSNIFSTKALNMTQGKEDLYEDSAPAEEAMTVTPDQPVRFEADANGNMVATQEPKPDTHQNPVQPKVQPPTEEEIAQAKELDAKVNTAREAADDYLTDGEKDALDQAGSVTTEKTQAMFSDPGMAPYIDNAYGETAKATQQAYWDTMLGNMNDVHQYETAQARLDTMKPQFDALQAKWGNVENYSDSGVEEWQDITLDDPDKGFDPANPLHVILEYNHMTGGFDVAGIYDDQGDNTELQGENFMYGQMNYAAVQKIADELVAQQNKEAAGIIEAQERYRNATDAEKAEIDEMKRLNMEINKAQAYIDDHGESYQAASKNVQDSLANWDTMYTTLTYLNGDTNAADQVSAVLGYVSQFYDITQNEILPYSKIQAIRNTAEQYGTEMTPETESRLLHAGMEDCDKKLEEAYWVRNWLEETGYELPDSIRINFKKYVKRLEHERAGYAYDTIVTDTDPEEFKKAVEAGRAFEEDNEVNMRVWNEIWNDKYEDSADQFSTLGFKDAAPIVTDNITQEEEDTYYYLLGKAVLAKDGKLDDNNKEEVLSVLKDANDYYNHLYDGEYGIVFRRWYDKAQERQTGYVDEGTLKGIGVNIEATLATALELPQNVMDRARQYFAEQNDEAYEHNQYRIDRAFSNMKQNIRAATNASIDNTYETGTWQNGLAKLGYEIYCNRGDSLVNTLTYGAILGEIFGTGVSMIDEIIGASPMGFNAACDSYEQAIAGGATKEQASLIAGVSFLGETLTEGITKSNIEEVFAATGAVSAETIKGFIKEWLTKSGLEEAIGESASEIADKIADYCILGENSDFQKTVDNYLASNPGMSDDKARQLAFDDAVGDIVHTAFVSYVSAGLDVVGKVGRVSLDNFNAYRTATRNLQQAGYNVSLADVIKADRQDKQMAAQAKAELDMSLARQAQADAAQALREEELRPFSFGEGQTEQTEQTTETNTEAAAETDGTAVSENTETKEAPAIDQTILTRPKVEITPEMKAAGTTLAALEESKRGDNSTKTAAIAAALTAADATPAQQEVSLAAAAGLRTAFGNQATNIVQRVMIGAQQAGIETETMQQALHYAALGGEESSCYQTIAHENFVNLTPADQAKMLASAVYNDSQNATVQQNMAGQVEGFAKAMAMKNLAANGHFDEANEAQRNAEQADANAKKAADELETQKSLEETKAQQTQDAVAALNENPGDHALADQVNHALTEQENQSKVTQEYEQAKVKADEQAAEAHRVADKKTADATTTARATSEQQRNEQLEQRRIEAEQRAEEARIAAEEAAAKERQQKIDDSRSGKLQEESDNAKIRRYAEGLGYTGEQLESFVQEMSNFKKDLDMKKVDLSKQLSPAEGYLMMGRLSRRFGVNVVIGDMENGDNGFYNPATNTITLSKDLTAGQVLVEFALHEFTHSLESTGAYQKYHDSVLGFMYPSEAELNKAIADKIADYADNGHTIDEAQAKNELVAEYTRTKLNDRDVINRMIDAGLGGRMRNALHNINQFFRNLTGKMSSEERQQAEYLRRAERMLNKAIREKARTQEKAETAKTGNNVKMNPNGAVTLTDWTANGNKGQDIDIVGVEFAPEDTLYITEDGQRIPRDHFEGGALGDGGQNNAEFGGWVTTEAERINQQENKQKERKPFARVSEKVSGETKIVKFSDGSIKSFNETSNDIARSINKTYKTNIPNKNISSSIQNARNLFISGDVDGAVNAVYELAGDIEKAVGLSRDSQKPSALAQALNGFFGNKVIPISESDMNALVSVYGSIVKANRVLADSGVKARLRLDKDNNQTGLRLDDVFRNNDHATAEGAGFDIAQALGNADTAKWEDVLYELDHQRETYSNQARDEYTNGGAVSEEDLQAEIHAAILNQIIDCSDVSVDENNMIQVQNSDESVSTEEKMDWEIDRNDTPFSSGVGELTDAQKAQMLQEAGVDYQNALDRGDMEAAQEDVDFAAEQAGYNTPRLYHGTRAFGFTEFDLGKGENLIFATSDRKVGETYSGETNRSKISEASTLNVDSLHGERLLNEAKKNLPKYEDYRLMSPEENENARNDARNDLSTVWQGFSDFVNDNQYAFDEAKMNIVTNMLDSLTNVIEAETEEDAEKAWDLFDRYSWEFKWMDDSLFEQFWETDRRNEQLYRAKNALLDYMYDGDIYTDSFHDHVFDNQIALELDANLHKGVYELYGKTGKQLVIDAEGSNWNQITPPEELNLYGPQRTRDIAEAAKALGYDSVLIQNLKDNGGETAYNWPSDVYIFFDANQVKSADTVTYDNNGNVIPLNERFNAENPDIRYSTGGENTDAQKMQALVDAGVITRDDANAMPLEGQNPTMSTAQGPKQRQFGQGMLQDSDEISAQAKAYVLAQNSYYPDTNAEQIDRAIKWIRASKQTPNSDGFAEALQKVTSNSFDYRSADGQARMVAVMGMAVAKGDDMAQVALTDAYDRQGTDIARALQARKLFRLMTPEGRKITLQNMLQNAQDEINQKGTNITLKFSDWIYKAAAVAESEEDFYKVRQAASQELGEQIPANWKQKFIGWRMVSMLGNPRTHIRNVVGNAMFVPFVGIKNKLGALMELGLDESQRTKTLGFASKEAREFAKQDAKKQKDVLTGEAKYKDSGTVKVEQKLFGQGKGLLSRTFGKFTQGWSDVSSDWLEKEDWVFLNRHYRNALAGYMTARNLTAKDMNGQTLEDARQYAITEAQKATYRDFNSVASWLNSKDRPEAARFIADAVLPFKKTPMNITKRGFEYSPLGLVKSLTYDLYRMNQYKQAKEGKLNAMPAKAISPAQWIDNIASSLTGSAIVAAGYLLGRLGVVNAGFDDDDPEDRLKKLKNEQEYSINIAGENITLDWAAPVCLPFFVGAQLGGDGGLSGKSFGEVLTAILSISEPIYNLSMMESVNSLLQTSAYEDEQPITQILEKIGLNYVSSYVPTIVGQAARTVDPTRRATYVESGAEPSQFYRTVEQIQNKLPFLTKLNTPYMNAVGEKQEKSHLSAALENFISPAYYNEITESELYDEWKRLIPSDTTGKAEFIPSNPTKTIKVGQETIRLTDTQYATLKEVTGTTGVSLCEAIMQRPEYKFASDENKIALMNLMWDYAKKAGQKAVDDRVNTDGWIKAAETSGDVVGSAINKLVDDNRKSYLKEKGASLAVTLESGQYEDAQTVVLEMRETAKATDAEIREQVSNYFRPLYYAAVQNGQDERAEDIIEDLRELDIGYKDSTFKSWYKNALGDETAEEDEDDDEEATGYLDWLNR